MLLRLMMMTMTYYHQHRICHYYDGGENGTIPTTTRIKEHKKRKQIKGVGEDVDVFKKLMMIMNLMNLDWKETMMIIFKVWMMILYITVTNHRHR